LADSAGVIPLHWNWNEWSSHEQRLYMMGAQAACEAVRSDKVYYEVCAAKPGVYASVRAAAEFVEAGIPAEVLESRFD
jgi:hypothetical protein